MPIHIHVMYIGQDFNKETILLLSNISFTKLGKLLQFLNIRRVKPVKDRVVKKYCCKQIRGKHVSDLAECLGLSHQNQNIGGKDGQTEIEQNDGALGTNESEE